MSTTLGIKLDDQTKQRLKNLAQKRDRSPHWLMKNAIEEYLKQAELYEAEKDEDQKRWDNYINTGISIDNATVNNWVSTLGKPNKK